MIISDSRFSRRSALRLPLLISGFCVSRICRSRSSVEGSPEWERRTRTALEQYRILAAQDDGAPLPAAENIIEPGSRYEGVPRLERLLRLLGDLFSPADVVDPEGYDGEIIAAVKRFQRRHGLEANGTIDQITLAALNTPLTYRVTQLEIALQRWRHLSYDPTRPALVLNLPEYQLRAYGEEGRPDLEMKIIIGQAPDRKTPHFSSYLESIILCPYWNVPLSIQRDELVPEILKDTSFLRANHLQVLTANGDPVESDVGPETIERLRTGRLRMRQLPGANNVLGLAKFVFPNEYGIYMHGTSAPWLFEKPRRDFSHGCIRVERPEDLAEWLLRRQSDWNRDRIVQAMHGSTPVGVKVRPPIQVATTYITAVVLENGEVHFLTDVYGEDGGKTTTSLE